jgi:hypothetical protein
MDKYRAEQLEKRINREASYLVTLLKDVSVVGEQLWGVSIYARSSGHYLGDIESSSEWEERKQADLKDPSRNS